MFSYFRKIISGVTQYIRSSLPGSEVDAPHIQEVDAPHIQEVDAPYIQNDAFIIGQDARLFAHIQNDAFITGLFALKGNYFEITSAYLKKYLESLARSGQHFNAQYNDILREMEYAIQIEKAIISAPARRPQASQYVDEIAKNIAHDLEHLAQGAKLTLPGGWTDLEGGHAMIYQFIREADHYLLKVINAGWGLQYHGKKSVAEKELYNPIKAWSIPLLQTPHDKNELAHFMGRLLKARLNTVVEMSGTKLYDEILPSISHIGGREISADKLTPDFAYTGGQLSGTCTQRSIHQMLKINSDSLEEYRRFIFKFKMHSLSEYADSCLKGEQPFNAPVAAQIHLAIENNLKILMTPTLFDAQETEKFIEELLAIKVRTNRAPLVPPQTVTPEEYAPLFVRNSPLVAKTPELTGNDYFALAAPITIDFSSGSFLDKLSEYVGLIAQINDSATRYTYLEQLILALPLSSTNIFIMPPYTSMKTLADYERFSGAVRQIQVLLHGLQTNWAKDTHLMKLNTLALSALTLRTEFYNVISIIKRLPSYQGFTDLVLNAIIGNHTRNPFWATNHPQLDARIILLQERFKNSCSLFNSDYFNYFNQLLYTERELYQKLNKVYAEKFGTNPEKLHQEIKGHQLQALYMISLHIIGSFKLDQQFEPLIQKVRDLLNYDTDLRRFVNPMYQTQYGAHPNLRIAMLDLKQGSSIQLYTPLDPTSVPYRSLSQEILKHKYNFASPSPAKDALEQDSPEYSTYRQVLNARTTNHIQLNPGKSKAPYRTITQDDIIARDYHHLRSNPNLQIALTLHYFTRNIDKLSDEADQRYIEANLFQIGLLLDAIKQEEFIPQFDGFLDTGLRFFTKSGQHTRHTLLFLRLNVLVSSYMALDENALGIARLTSIQDEILKQLQLATDSDIIYVLQQYLFLATIRKIESKAQASHDLELALNAYRYIQGHSNPSILEDRNHTADLETAVARFQALMSQQRSHLDILIKKHLTTADLNLEGSFPNYRLTNPHGTTVYKFNAILGKLFEGYLAISGIPLTIKNHPLLKRLGLNHFNQCLMSADQSYMVLPNPPKNTEFFYKNHQLTIRQQWSINRRIDTYELHAISPNHLTRHANSIITLASSNLPKTLKDGSIDFWQSTTFPGIGLLVQNNRACYAVEPTEITLLDDEGFKTDFKLKPLHKDWAYKLTRFESSAFMQHHESHLLSHVVLPRFNLCFERSGDELRHTETNEGVVDRPSPIDPQVAGMILTKDGHERYLIPIARFYATRIGAVISDFYPVVHDTDGTIASKSLEKLWRSKPPLHTPLWHHQNSAAFISFRLKDGKPITETAADAIYLAYIYLSTNQTQNAWDTLEDCKKRLGGLTGSAAELKYISWIVNSLPHILYDQEKETKDAIRETPPYIACKLKALSLACDYLSDDKTFNLEDAPSPEDISANAQYKILELEASTNFLTELPKAIYQYFTRLQKMRRHLEGSYTLSTIERKRLLNYYQLSQAKEDAPKGALGYEWMQLNLEALQDERRALLALEVTRSISGIDRQRLSEIDAHFRQLKPVLAQSTKLKLVPINLEIAQDQELNQGYLGWATQTTLRNWIENLPGIQADAAKQEQALHALSSNINEDELITYFPVYLQIAQSADTAPKKALKDFCIKALIANRHIPLKNQRSNQSFLFNILYRVQSCKNVYLGMSYSLKQLVNTYRTIAVEPPSVYEAYDVYESILASADALLQQPKAERRLAIKPTSDYRLLIEDVAAGSALAELLESYHQFNQALDDKMITQSLRLKANPEQSVAIEAQAGIDQLEFEIKQREIANALSQVPGAKAQISELISNKIPQIKRLQEGCWEQAFALANQGPDDPEINQKWRIERLAKARPMLTTADLCSLYNQADLNFIIEKTGLSEKNAQELYGSIHHALIYGIQNKMLTNMQEGLHKDSLAAVLDVLAKKEIPALDEPAIILLQHEEEIVLRPRQVSALKHLLETSETGKPFRESVEKIIPGGGKSKVILPILAEKKARGDNLVIIEVPQALIATNHVDLNQMSQRLFNKAAYRFEFSRDSNSSSARLEQLFTQFTEIITTRGYLVTTGESIQSLELKYLELLLSEEEHNKEWQQQIFWCDKIVNLLHHRGDAVIDEVHQGLWIKKKLNYTLGNPKPILPSTIQNAIALFRYIDSEFVKQAPFLDKDYNWDAFKKALATKLITEINSPLSDFVKDAKRQYGQGVTDHLIAYILNQAQTQCEAIKTASDETKSVLAFFKQEVSVILPQTLGRRLDENYGASKRADLNPIEQTLAIPYAANNIPNERSRFGNHLEAVNYTCQMMLLNGISKEIMIARISLWLSSAEQELFKNPLLKEINQTPTAQGFAMTWTEKFRLQFSEINLKDADQMSVLHTQLQHDRELIFDILESQSLKLINLETGIIHSDSFNHVDLYRTVQGISGTPSNHTTYHERLEYDQTTSLGTDGYIIQLLHYKNTPITNIDYENATQFINRLFANPTKTKQCRAIIDISATFQGISNLQVAQQIAEYTKGEITKIKHILYFNNEDQVLCAISVHKPNAPILLKSSDVDDVNLILGTTPDERFTYYDQARTLGTDITQDTHAHAFVLVDEKTSLQSFLQGSMRMRGISQNQTIELVTPRNLAEVTLAELINKFNQTDESALVIDNLVAAKEMMTNLARRISLDWVQALPSEKAADKARLAQQLKTFFISNPSNDLFALYGAQSSKQSIEDILAHCQKQVLSLLKVAIQSASIDLTKEHEAHISARLQGIIDKTLPNCPKEYEGSPYSLGVEVEVHKEVQQEEETQVMCINQQYEPTLVESPCVFWERELDFFGNYNNSVSWSLNAMCSPSKAPGPVTLFSPELRVSTNYAQTHTMQTEWIDAFLKPVFTIWYHQDSRGNLTAMIITPQDAQELQDRIKMSRGNWLTTTANTVLCGTRPIKMLANLQYQSLQEQIRFFNGEFDSFLKADAPMCWLNQKQDEKIRFFEERLLSFRPESLAKFQELKTALNESNMEGYDYIVQHPFDDLTDYDWHSLNPNTSHLQIVNYKNLAMAFDYINHHWQDETITIHTLKEQFRIPIRSLGYLNTHLHYLKGMQSLIHRHAIFLTGNRVSLLPNELNAIEKGLGMTLDAFYELNRQIPQEYINRILLITTLVNCPVLQIPPQLSAILNNYAKNAPSSEVLIALIRRLSKLPLNLIEDAMDNPYCDEHTITAILESNAPISEDILLKLALKCTAEEQRKLLTKYSSFNDEHLLSIIPDINEETLSELLRQNHKAVTNSVLTSIVSSRTCSTELILDIVSHPKASASTWTGALKTSPVLLTEAKTTVQRWDSDSAICPHVLEKIMLNAAIESHEVDTVSTIAKIACKNINRLPTELLWAVIALNALRHIPHAEMINLIENFNKKPMFALDVLKIFGRAVINKLPISDMIEAADNIQLETVADPHFTENCLSSDELSLLFKHCSTKKQLDLLLARNDLNPAHLNQILCKKGLNDEQLLLIIKLSSYNKTSDFNSFKKALSQLNTQAQDQWLNDIKHQQEKVETAAKNSGDPALQLSAAIEKLGFKAITHTVKSIKNTHYDAVAKTAFELYQKLTAENGKPQIDKQQFLQYIADAKPVLEAHRGYKQVLVDIFNALLILLGAVKYYVTGDWRFFKTNTDSINIVNEIINDLNHATKLV